jgi:hypothetical protein
MNERTILEWEEYITNSYSAARAKSKYRSWDIPSKDWEVYSTDICVEGQQPTYTLVLSTTLIIRRGIPTFEEAKQMAQHLQDVMDGFKPTFSDIIITN